MSGIELRPVDGGDAVPVPQAKTTIGRGPFLQVTDKRVSRSHATLEVDEDGTLVLTPIHTNPCFLRVKGSKEQVILPRDKPRLLKHGDVLGLLPDQLFYKIVYKDHKSDSEENADQSAKSEETGGEEVEDPTQNGDSDGENSAEESKKARKLPGWMAGSAKKTPKKGRAAKASSPQQTTPRRPQRAAAASAKKKTRDEFSDDGEDYEEVVAKKPRGRGKRKAVVTPRRTPARKGRKKVEEIEENEEEEEGEGSPPSRKQLRQPRAASLKVAKYIEGYVEDEDAIDWAALSSSSHSSDDEGRRRKHGKQDIDSDFVADDDSGSDWEEGNRKSKAKARGTPHKLRGRPPGVNARKRGRGRPRRRTRDSDDDDEEFDDNYEKYVPRLSKRRASSTAQSRSQDSGEEEEEEEEFVEVKQTRKPRNGKKRKVYKEEDDDEEEEEMRESRPKRNGKKRKVYKEDDDEEEEEEKGSEDEKKPTMRTSCQYGKKCYRKNPKHLKEYCHPGDSSYEEEEEEDEKEDEGEEEKTEEKKEVGAGDVRKKERKPSIEKEENNSNSLDGTGDNTKEEESCEKSNSLEKVEMKAEEMKEDATKLGGAKSKSFELDTKQSKETDKPITSSTVEKTTVEAT